MKSSIWHNAIVGILISLFVFLSGCSMSGYSPLSKTELINTKKPYVFSDDFTKAIYKTSINIYGNGITGLTLIKKSDSVFRVVAMSELGMKYFDIEYPIDSSLSPKVHYIMEVLNKKLLINILIKDFALLFYPPELTGSIINIKDDNDRMLLVKHKKLAYFTNQLGVINEISKQRCFGKMNPIVMMSNYNQTSPLNIKIDHGRINLEFELVD